MWVLFGLVSLYFAYVFISRRNKISPLSINANEMKDVVDTLPKSTYQCRDYVTIENSFLLRPECSMIPSVADLAVILVPTEFDRSEIAFDFSIIPNQELEDILGTKNNGLGMIEVDDNGVLRSIEFDANAISNEDLVSALEANRSSRSRASTSLYIDTVDDEPTDHLNDHLYNMALNLSPDEILSALHNDDATAQEFGQLSNMYDVYGDEEYDEFTNPEFADDVEFDFDQLTQAEIEAALGHGFQEGTGLDDDGTEVRGTEITSSARKGNSKRTSIGNKKVSRGQPRSGSVGSSRRQNTWKSAQPGGTKKSASPAPSRSATPSKWK
jgi:hypothetical protein